MINNTQPSQEPTTFRDVMTIRAFLEYLGVPDMPHATVHGWKHRGCLKMEKSNKDGGGYCVIRRNEAARFKAMHQFQWVNSRWNVIHLGEDTIRNSHRPVKSEQAPLPLPAKEPQEDEKMITMFREFLKSHAGGR